MYEQLQTLAIWLAKAAELWSGLMAFAAVAGAGMAAGMALQARRAKRIERAAIRQLVLNGLVQAPIHHAPPVAKARRAEPPPDRPNALGSCKSDGWVVEVSDL